MSDSLPRVTTRTGDAAIVERASRGDHAAFVALVDAWLSVTYRTVLASLGSETVARDATVEIFGRAWRNLPELREPEGFEAWFERIVTRTCRTAASKGRSRGDSQIGDMAQGGRSDSWAARSGTLDPRTRRFDPSELRPVIAQRTAGMRQRTIHSRRSVASGAGRVLGRVAGRVVSRVALAIVVVAVLLGGALTLAVVDRRPVPPVQLRTGLLAFIQHGAVYLANADGSNARLALHQEGLAFRSLAWAPNGIQLALVADSGTVVLDARTGSTVLVRGQDPAWASDGRLAVLIPADDSSNTSVQILNGATLAVSKVLPFAASGGLTWSPDGQWIAATGGPNGANGLIRIDTISGAVINLDGDPGDSGGPRDPAWSPDSRQIAFTRWDDNPGACNRCASDVIVADADGARSQKVNLVAGMADQPAWSPDGQWLAFRNVTHLQQFRGRQESPTGLTIARPDGSDQRTLVAAPADGYAWAAESDRLLYVLPSPDQGGSATIREVTLANDERLLDSGIDDGLAFGSSGAEFALQLVKGNGPLPALSSLVQAPEPSSGLHLVSPVPGRSLDPRSGWPMLATDAGDACRPVTVDSLTGRTHPVATVCTTADEINSVAWSPTGSAYALIVNGQLVVAEVNGTVHLNVANLGGLDGGVTWSPDGKWLGLDGSNQYILSADGLIHNAIPGSPSWSPDGRTLAVETPGGMLLVGPPDGSLLMPVGSFPPPFAWSSDGSRFAFLRDGNVWTAGRDGNDVRNITALALGGASNGAGSIDGQWLAVSGSDGIWLMHFDGSSRSWLGFGAQGGPGGLAWSPDSSRLAVEDYDASSTTPHVLIVRTDGGPAVEIDAVVAPGWSGDSRLLVVSSVQAAGGGGGYSSGNLQVLFADGSGRHDLPVSPSGMTIPAWLN